MQRRLRPSFPAVRGPHRRAVNLTAVIRSSMRAPIFRCCVAIVAASVVISCPQPVDPDPGEPPPEYHAVLPDTTKQVDTETASALSAVSADGSTLTFSGTTTQLSGLEPGDVLCLGVSDLTPNGLLRSVISVEESGGDVIVTTEQATLEEAVQEGHLGFSGTLDSGEIIPTALGSGTRLITSPQNVTPRALNLDLTDVQVLPGVYCSGEISFDVDLEFDLDIDWFTLEHCLFLIGVNYDAELEFEITAEAEAIEETVEVGSIRFPPIIVPAGILLVFVPELSLNVGVDGSMTRGMNARVVQSATLNAGLEYEEGWHEIKEFTSTFSFDTPKMDAAVSMKGFIGPELSIKLYDIVGPYANTYGYLKLDAAMLNSEPWWELHGGLDLGAGVEIEVLSEDVTIADWGVPDLIHYDRLLATGTGTENHNWTLQTIDDEYTDADNFDKRSSITVDDGGEIHIAYAVDGPETWDDEQVKYAHFDGEVWTRETIETESAQNAGPAIGVAPDGTVYISYYRDDSNNETLAAAELSGGEWSITDVHDTAMHYNEWCGTSLAFSTDGVPHIAYAYWVGSDSHVGHAWKDDGEWTWECVNPGQVELDAHSPSIALDSADVPHIAYLLDRHVWYAVRGAEGWDLECYEDVNNVINQTIELALDSNDRPHIVFRDSSTQGMDVHYFRNLAGTWEDDDITSGIFDAAGHLFLALSETDIPHITFFDTDADTLRHAYWQGSGWAIGAVDETSTDSGRYNAMFIDGETPYVTYYDEEHERLRLAIWTGG
jgi:hypothetical protein